MVAILKRGASRKKMQELLQKLQSRMPHKGVNTQKYCGVIELKEDALEVQKRLRNEWN